MARKKWDVNDEEVYDYVSKRIEEGEGPTKSILEYCGLTGLPESRVRCTYYNMKRDKQQVDIEDVAKKLLEPPKEQVNDIHVLTEIIELSERTETDISGIFNALVPLLRAATKTDAIEMAERNAEIERSKRIALEAEMEELRHHVKVLDGYLEEFLNMPSLKKIGKLEDFTYQLKLLVDNTGLVHRAERY